MKEGHVSFAGLDVTYNEPLAEQSEIWSLENVLLTPHSSCCYEDYLHLFIDELHEKVNSKMSRSEVSGWIVAVSALVVLVNTVAM